jgi:VanZ family protein
MSIHQRKTFRLSQSRALLFAWVSLLMLIFCLSVFGRMIQAASRQWISGSGLATVFMVVTLLLFVLSIRWALKNHGPRVLWHLLWLIPLFVIFPLSLSIVEERLHFILFGGFGFVSLLLWRPVVGVLVCCLMSGGDELLQWFLPSRVGDWKDVGFNLLACLGGAAIALLGKK